MMFTNINIISIIIVLVLIVGGGYFYVSLLRRDAGKKQLHILFFIFLLLVLSLLGPRGGMISRTSTLVGGNIAFVVDVSRSMDALDFENKTLSRLDMTKDIISQFLKKQPNNKYALDVFSGESIKLLPLTSDISIYETFLSGINHSNVGAAGTNIIKALYSSISHFIVDETGGLIVLFTDGGDEAIGDMKDIKKVLDEKNLKVLIVGVGSTKGSYIPIGKDFLGRIIYKTYEGKKVFTQLNTSELEKLGNQLGSYIEIQTVTDIDKLYNIIDTNSQKIAFESDTEQARDLVLIFILVGFLLWLLFLGGMLFSKLSKK